MIDAISILCESEEPGGKICCIAKSPSSKVGINSPPIFVKTKKLNTNKAMVANTKTAFKRKATFKTGA